MRRSSFCLATLVICFGLSPFFLQPAAAAENPLVRGELHPIKNADFEQGLAHWVRTAEDVYTDEKQGITYRVETNAAEGKKSLSIETTRDSDIYLGSPTLTVPRDGRYYLSAKIRTEGNVYGCVRPVAGADGEQFSTWIGPDSDWSETGLAFTSTGKTNVSLPPGQTEYDPTRSYIQLRLQVRGQGKVYFDDIRVYETFEYSPCFRVKMLEPAGRPFRVKLHSLVGAPNWYFTRTYLEEGQAPGKFSPWIDLRRMQEFMGSRMNPTGLQFEPISGPPFEKIKVEIEFSSSTNIEGEKQEKKKDAAEELLDLDNDLLDVRSDKQKPATKDKGLYNKLAEDAVPDPAKFRETKVFETPGHVIGVFIPSATVSPDEYIKGLRPLMEDVKMRNDHVRSLNLPPVKLDHYYVEAHHKGFEHFFTDPTLLEMEVDTIQRIGFSALDSQYAGLAGEYRRLAEKAGIAQTHQTTVGHSLVEDPREMVATFNEAELRSQVAQKVDQWFARLQKDDPEQLSKIRFFVLCDEIWGVALAGPAFAAGYRSYLKEHGITPEELGVKSYEEIKFDKTWGWRESWDQRPEDKKDLAACKDYYWRLRYWSYATAKIYAMITAEIQRRLPGVPTVINHGAPWAYGYDGYMRGVEVFEFARQNAVTAFLHEDWLNTSGWRHSGIQLCGFLADFSRSIGRVNGSPAFAYVMPAGKDAIQLKLAATVGKGVKTMDLYRYGPAYGSPDNWSQNLPQVEGVAKYLRQLDQAEDTLANALPRQANTAIIWSASNDAWRVTDATVYDQQLIYLALQHKQIPVDIVDEFSIEDGKLQDYKVAYLNARYVRKDAQQQIVDWVKAGGHLWVDALAGTGDEYGQPSELIEKAIGLQDVKVTLSDETRFETQNGLPLHKALDHLSYKDTDDKVEVIGRQVKFTVGVPQETEILATYEDGSPAVIERKLGEGSIYYVGATAGCVYSRPVIRDRGKIERGYRDQERRMITDFALANHVVRPTECNIAGVQADLLEGPSGTGIVLANFTGEEVEKIQLTVHLTKPVTQARSVEHGPLEMKLNTGGNTATLEMPLSLTDFVLFE